MVTSVLAVCSSQPLIKTLCESMRAYLPENEIKEVYRAYIFSAQAHGEQKRLSGEPYISHPVSVAYILAQMCMDYQTLSAALLHDVIEDTPISRKEVAEKFGETVAMLVSGVSKLSTREITTTQQHVQAENISRVLMAMQEDIRVIIIKLADRLHNMRTISAMKATSQQRISRETLEIYAPIASRLGMNQLSIELEELCFKTLYPLRHRILSRKIKDFRKKRRQTFALMHDSIQKQLEKYLIKAEIIRQMRHNYGIYSEMAERKKLPSPDNQKTFQQSMETYTFQVIVDNIDDCYRALGWLHNLHNPMVNFFKDYIATPKRNGYQSLHTVLFPSNVRANATGTKIKVQIRTKAMHEQAELGIVAHTLSIDKKEEMLTDSGIASSESYELNVRQHVSEWLRSLLEIHQSSENSLEFIENVKIDLSPKEITVFNIFGEAIRLPERATVIDFAYAQGSNEGNKCVSAKVDGQTVLLTTPIAHGQTIEIFTEEWGRPKASWLDAAVSARARVCIQHFLKNFQDEQAIDFGKRLLDKELTIHNLSFDKLNETQLANLLKSCNVNSVYTLLLEIGTGKRVAAVVVSQLNSDVDQAPTVFKLPEQKVESKPLTIKGTEGLVVKFPRCCYPIPDDEIVGIMRPEEGMIIHRKNCKKIISSLSKNWMDLEWESNIKQQFKAEISIDVPDKRGVLATIAKALSNMRSNIGNISNKEQDGIHSTIRLAIYVDNRKHLADVIRHVRRLEDVIRIQRS